MLTPPQSAAFHHSGFLVSGQVLAGDELGELTSELDRILAKGPDGFSEAEPSAVS